jgi:hypothetical protein
LDHLWAAFLSPPRGISFRLIMPSLWGIIGDCITERILTAASECFFATIMEEGTQKV